MPNKDSAPKIYLPAALRWLESMCSDDHWQLTLDDLSAILSKESSNIEILIDRARENKGIQQDDDLTDNIALLVQIHKHLTRITPFSTSNQSVDWFNQPNSDPLFGGQTIKEYLCKHSPPDSLRTVVGYLTRY